MFLLCDLSEWDMKLSEQLKQDNDSGDFGKALEGYSERAKALEEKVFTTYYNEACEWGATNEKATEYATERLRSI